MPRLTTWIVAMVLVPAFAGAQDRSHWGVIGSVTPAQNWNVISPIDEYVFSHGGTADVTSADFSIGIARGRELGGDWGVSFVRRSVKDDSRFESFGELCFDTCTEELSEALRPRRVRYSGVEAHKYFNFATIARRVQIGLNVAGGVGRFEGNIERHYFYPEPVFDARGVPVLGAGGSLLYRTREEVLLETADQLPSFTPFPLGKVELALGVIAAPGLKIRASGGFNFPGYSMVRVNAIYLFGAK